MEIGERQKLDEFGIRTVTCVGKLFFYKKHDSVAVFLNIMHSCRVYFVTSKPDITPDDGFFLKFSSQDEAEEWLKENQYTEIHTHEGEVPQWISMNS